jgi:hypothetical protein
MAAGSTYTPIETRTLGSAQADITFSSITGSYTDLVIVANIIRTSGSDLEFQLNGNTGSSYSTTFLFGDGSTAQSINTSNAAAGNAGYSASTNPMTMIMQLQNYSNATTFKTILVRNSPAANAVSALVNLYRSTSAITSIKFYTTSGNLNTGSTFTLYGIAAA